MVSSVGVIDYQFQVNFKQRLTNYHEALLTNNFLNQVVNVEEVPTWLAGDHLPAVPITTLLSWKETGPRNLNIENCTDFCDPHILTNIIGQKVHPVNKIFISIYGSFLTSFICLIRL